MCAEWEGPEGCYTVGSLPALTLNAVRRVCALCALQIQRVTCLHCVLVVALWAVNVLRGTCFNYVSLLIQLFVADNPVIKSHNVTRALPSNEDRKHLSLSIKEALLMARAIRQGIDH